MMAKHATFKAHNSLLVLGIVASLSVGAGVGLVPWTQSVAHADDWDVKRDPFDPGVVRRYKRILARNPNDKGALSRLSTLYRKYRTLSKLIGEYKAQLSRNPKDYSALIVLGRLAQNRNKPDEAASYMERAAKLRPKDAKVFIALGDLYRQNSKRKKARAAYDQALVGANAKQRKTLLKRLAALALDAKDLAGARKYYQSYFALAPKDVRARVEFGDALQQHKKYAEAIAIFKKAEAEYGRNKSGRIDVIARLGSAYEASGQDTKAIAEYRRAMGMTSRTHYLRKDLTERIIDIHRKRQSLGTLLKRLEKDWPKRRRDHFEWDVLARLYEEVGNQDKAVSAYRSATKKAPYELDTQRRLIKLLENSGREAEALAQYERVIRVAPGEPRFQLELARRYHEAGKKKKALALLAKIEARFSGDAGVHSVLADLYVQWGLPDRALKSYERLTRIEPGEAIHLVNLGEQYHQRGKKKKAVAIWKKIAARKTADGYARLGRVYAEHDMADQALDMYKRAIKLKPKNEAYYRGRASVYEQKRRWSLAVADWERVFALIPKKASNKPRIAEARRRIVSLLSRARGRMLSRRMRDWRRAFPPSIDSGFFLVEAHLKRGQLRDARRVLEKILNLRPTDRSAMELLVRVYRSGRKYEKAIAIIQRLIKLEPTRKRELYNEIAELMTRLNKDQKAIYYAQKALQSSPNDPVAHQRLAERYLDMQQYGKAMSSLAKVIELDPKNFTAYFILARLYQNQQKLKPASKLYRELLRRASDEDVLERAGHAAIKLEELMGSLDELERVVAPLAFSFAHKDIYRRILVQLYAFYVPSLVAKSRQGSDAQRTRALSELERLGAHGLKPLLEALSDTRDPEQKRIAVSVLGYLGNKGAAAPLVRVAAEAPKDGRRRQLDWEHRLDALIAAGRLGDPRTIPALVKLSSNSEVSMREAATFALGMTGDKRAMAPLVRSLADRRSSVQTLACLGLAHVGRGKRGTAVMRDIIGVVKDQDRADSTRAACAFALGVMGDTRAADALSSVLDEGDDEVQRISAWSLGQLGDQRALPSLFRAYVRKRSRTHLRWALSTLANKKSGRLRATQFMEYPTRGGKFDQMAAIERLPPVPRGNPAPLPTRVIVSQANAIAAEYKRALTRHRDALERALIDLDSAPNTISIGWLSTSLPASRAKGLRKAMSKVAAELRPSLERLTNHKDRVIRRRAISILAKTGSSQEFLLQSLADKTPERRRDAMFAVAPRVRRGGRQGKALAAAVSKSLSSGPSSEQVFAAQAMASYGRGADQGALIQALKGGNTSFVRAEAAKSLGSLGVKKALPALRTAISDPSYAVSLNAVQAIERIGGAKALRRATKGLKLHSSLREEVKKLLSARD